MTRTTIRSEDITAGQVKAADLASDAVDTTGIQTDIAILGFKVAANGSLAKYDLVDQTIDDFQDATGVDASASTNETRNASDYYSGGVTADATGGTITNSGGKTIHTFNTAGNGTSTNDFVTPASSSSIEYLVVGGAGGGGAAYTASSYGAAGGGAGGFRTATGFTVAAQTYAITTGAGGDGVVWSASTQGNTGAASVFSTISSAGGGGGGSRNNTGSGSAQWIDGLPGGSGGGSSYESSAGTPGAGNTPSTSPSQGNTGGQGAGSRGGGGGGASAMGANGGAGGQGGAGTANSISGASVTYAGGSGGGGGTSANTTGGAGGAGGGGAGGNGYGSRTGGSGTDGLGGGGGGMGATGAGTYTGQKGGDGGNGVVIISYTTDGFVSFNDMTLISNATTAEAVATKGDLVMTYTNGVGTATVNTDIKGWVSRDNGTNYTQFTQTDDGDTGGHTILTAHDLDISAQPSGTAMRYEITTHNQSASKETRIQAVSLGWS